MQFASTCFIMEESALQETEIWKKKQNNMPFVLNASSKIFTALFYTVLRIFAFLSQNFLQFLHTNTYEYVCIVVINNMG
jgi:hypothetical protein